MSYDTEEHLRKMKRTVASLDMALRLNDAVIITLSSGYIAWLLYRLDEPTASIIIYVVISALWFGTTINRGVEWFAKRGEP